MSRYVKARRKRGSKKGRKRKTRRFYIGGGRK